MPSFYFHASNTTFSVPLRAHGGPRCVGAIVQNIWKAQPNNAPTNRSTDALRALSGNRYDQTQWSYRLYRDEIQILLWNKCRPASPPHARLLRSAHWEPAPGSCLRCGHRIKKNCRLQRSLSWLMQVRTTEMIFQCNR